MTLIGLATTTILLAIAALALGRGGGPEKAVATTLLIMALADPLGRLVLPQRFDRVDYVNVLIDLAALVALTYIALCARRFWPLCVASLQLATSVSHLVRAMDTEMTQWSYAIMQLGYSYLMMAVTLVGISRQGRRTATGSAPRSPDWSPPYRRREPTTSAAP